MNNVALSQIKHPVYEIIYAYGYIGISLMGKDDKKGKKASIVILLQ